MSDNHYQSSVPLAPYTSFAVGGNAEKFIEVNSTEELIHVLEEVNETHVWLLGYGSNTLISDAGLPGLTIVLRGGDTTLDDTTITADAGVWWDDIVKLSIDNGLWGIELMSEIPGSLGGALFINITAYGQSIGERVRWVEVWEPLQKKVIRFDEKSLVWDYKKSLFQKPALKDSIILRANIELSKEQTTKLTYQKAVDVAQELGLDTDSLHDRREIIIEARRRAGSLWSPHDKKAASTVGSFFRNPLVSADQAEAIIRFDESGKTAREIKNMNKVHGGDTKRVSAAHVMLASGFTRGQILGKVKLNEKNLLKLETMSGATAQDVYAAMKYIQKTCLEKVAIHLEPEARIVGDFE